MTNVITRHRVSVNTPHNVQVSPASACYPQRMNDGWFQRLRSAVENDGRTKRELSRLAGRGVNFVQQIFKDGKEPGADKLASLLDVLGPEAAIFVMTGLEMSAEDQAFLRLLASYDPEQKRAARQLIEAVLARQAQPAPPPSPSPPGGATDQE